MIAAAPYIAAGVAIAVVFIAVVALVASMIVAMAGGPQAQADMNATAMIREAGLTDQDIASTMQLASDDDLPWQVLVALRTVEKMTPPPVLRIPVPPCPSPPEPDPSDEDETGDTPPTVDTTDYEAIGCPSPVSPDDVDDPVEGTVELPAPDEATEEGESQVVTVPVDVWGSFRIYPDRGIDRSAAGSDELAERALSASLGKALSGNPNYIGEASLLQDATIGDDGLTVDVTGADYTKRRAVFIDAISKLPVAHADDPTVWSLLSKVDFDSSPLLSRVARTPGWLDKADQSWLVTDALFADHVYDTAQAWALGQQPNFAGSCSTGTPYTGDAVAGLTQEQTANADAILRAAEGAGLPSPAGQIGLAVALAESSLLNYANDGTSTLTIAGTGRQLTAAERDVARRSLEFPHQAVGNNLDSMGLFQQRPSAGWGPPEVLMDPVKSAGLFFQRLSQVAGWNTMDPWVAGQQVQRSAYADGSNYRAKWAQAGQIADALGVSSTPALPVGPGNPTPPTGGTLPDVQAPVCGLFAGGTVVADGPEVVLPDSPYVDPRVRGKSLVTPNPNVAAGIAAGLSQLGLPYVWGGGGSGAGPNNGCARGGGDYNSCGSEIGFDCSGLTAFVLVGGGFPSPGGSSPAQRSGGQRVPYSAGLPGDIVGFPGHVAIYLGTIDGAPYILEASWVGIPIHVVPLTRGDRDDILYRYWS